MNLIEKIKQNENTPIYLAFTLGILTGTIIGFLASPVKAESPSAAITTLKIMKGAAKRRTMQNDI